MNKQQYQLSKDYEYACLIVGDELLDARVIELNYSVLSKSLTKKGYALKEVRIISDNIDDIANNLSELRMRYSFVVTAGGIGPTHDDITLEAVAKSFNCNTVLHKNMYQYCKNRPKHTNVKEAAITKMSTMPEEMEIIENNAKWPLLKMHNCYIMPGLPTVCRLTIEKLFEILPKLATRWYGAIFLNVYEHSYFEWLKNIAIKYHNTVELGSYPLDVDNELLKKGVFSKMTLSSREYHTSIDCFNEITTYMKDKKWLMYSEEITRS